MTLTLEGLWKKRLATLLTNLAKGLREHEEVASLAGHIGADYAGRFLIELIQNANDQAVLGGFADSTIVVVRTPDLVAVTNEGRPFDDAGLLAITSLGVSPKEAGLTIGNKGVGFKAVFQVTDAPELFSGPVGKAAATVLDEGGLRFRFDRDPLSQSTIHRRLEELIEQTIRERSQDAEELRLRSSTDPQQAMRDAIRGSASFRYPIPVDRTQLEARLAALDLPRAGQSAQTLIVLPLLRDSAAAVDEDAAGVVAQAFDELRSHGDAIVLFLNGVSRIVIDDRVVGETRVLRRQQPRREEELPRGSRYLVLSTACEATRAGATHITQQQWVAARRTIGDQRIDDGRAGGEGAALRDAVQHLPGRNWSEVETAEVTVAVKVPEFNEIGAPLEPTGLLCIGLPTRMPSGTPVWVDARFHGNLPRTEIHWNHKYNELLLTEAVSLVGDLVARWKCDPLIGVRRLATLVLEPLSGTSSGVLKARLHAPGGLAQGPVVLANDGVSFVGAADIVVPAPSDMEMFALMAPVLADATSYGFVLPEPVLLAKARSVLDALPGSRSQQGAPLSIYLERTGGRPSVLETVARRKRTSDHSFWGAFLSWVARHFTSSPLISDQCILPVGRTELASPDRRVFLRPIPRAKGDALTGGEATEEEIELEEPAGDRTPGDRDEDGLSNRLPPEVAGDLPFLDEVVVRAREADSPILTDLGRALAPERGEKLVRRPQAAEVINDLFGPRLRTLGDSETEAHLGLVLLRTAMRWIRSMKGERRKEIQLGELRVPVTTGDGGIAWIPPGEACFGEGWWDGRVGELLTELATRRPGRSVLSWRRFAEIEGQSASDSSRQVWREDLRSLGVAVGPRILKASCGPLAPLYASSYRQLSPRGAPCPVITARQWWDSYLAAVGDRNVAVATFQEYELREVIWLDGFEDESLRPILAELVLRNPGAYSESLWTFTWRRGSHKDDVRAPALWVHAWVTDDWPVIPTDRDGLCAPSVAFQLEDDQRRLERTEHLATVQSAYRDAIPILKELGVPFLSDASPERLAGALHRLAERLPVRVEAEQAAAALAHDLFDRLQSRCKQNDAVDLSALVSRLVPLEQGRQLVAVDLRTVDRIYVVDDAVRYRLLSARASLALPLRSGDRFVAFVTALRKVIGPERVAYASEAQIDSGFVRSEHSAAQPVLDFLATSYPGIEMEVALVIAYLGQQTMDPTKDRFREVWSDLTRTSLVRGRFSEGFQHSSLLERTPTGPVLMVHQDEHPSDVVAALYALAGAAHRYAFVAFARALKEGRLSVERFIREEVSPAQRDEVAAAIGAGSQGWVAPLKSVVFAIWRTQNASDAVSRFHESWRKGLTWDELVKLVGGNRVAEVLRQIARSHDDSTLGALLNDEGIGGADFIRMCGELGETWRFESSRVCFERLRCDLVAVLRTGVARLRGDVDLAAMETTLQAIQHEETPADILYAPPTRSVILRSLLVRAGELVRDADGDHPLLPVIHRLTDSDAVTLDLTKDSGFPAREIGEFRDRDADARAADARETLDAILKVAAAVATAENEELDAEAVRTDPRVIARSGGPFANRFTLLGTLRDALDQTSPRTVVRLSDARAFHEPTTWQVIWKKLEALLGPVTSSVPEPTGPTPRLVVLGVGLDEDEVGADLGLGEAGLIGQKILAACDPELDLATLRSHRHGAPPEPRKGRPGGERRGRGRSHKEARKEHDRVGLLGEIFVLAQLRKVLPNFDHSNWTSENRGAWAGLSRGADGYAADFDYDDVDGVLTGLPGAPKCFIEVKSSSGDADEAFFMTSSEWRRAEVCHRSGGSEVYVIVRVADVTTAPRLVDILVDPVAMEAAGHLRLTETEFWVGVGPRMAAEC